MSRAVTDFLYLLKFGRLTRDKSSGDAAGEYVGRDGERALLVDALTNAGARGAYLITGRRGVGKTTFVESCLSEYQAGVFKRFLRAPHGRSLLDKIAMAILALMFILAMVVLSDLLEQVAAGWSENRLLLLLAVPLILIMLLPAAYGLRSLRMCSTLLSKYTGASLSFIITITCLFFLLFIAPTGSPAISMMFFLIFIVFLLASSILMHTFRNTSPQTILYRRFLLFLLFSVFVIILLTAYLSKNSLYLYYHIAIISIIAYTLYYLLGSIAIHKKGKSDNTNIILIGRIKVLVFLSLFQISFSLYSHDLLYEKLEINKSFFYFIISYSMIIIVTTVTVSCVIFFFKSKKDNINTNIAKENDGKRFAPPIECLLLIKGMFFITITLHLIYPAVNFFPTDFEHFTHTLSPAIDYIPSSIENLGKHKLSQLTESLSGQTQSNFYDYLSPPRPFIIYSLESTPLLPEVEVSSKNTRYLTLFSEPKEEYYWIIAVFLFCYLLFLTEYDWINRTFIAERQSSAMGLSPRMRDRPHSHIDPVWVDECIALTCEEIGSLNKKAIYAKRSGGCTNTHHIKKLEKRKQKLENIKTELSSDSPSQRNRIIRMRALERNTLPWLIISMWMPSIIVRINLGFDALDHRGVTHAMLRGLRNAYSERFMKWHSPYALLRNFSMAMLLVLTVSFISEETMDFPKTKILNFSNEENFYHSDPEWSTDKKSVKDLWHLDTCAILGRGLKDSREGRVRGNDESEKVARLSPIPEALCNSAPGFANAVLPLLYTVLVPIRVDQAISEPNKDTPPHLAFVFLHVNYGIPTLTGDVLSNERSLSLRVYHVFIFLFVIALLRMITRLVPIMPYRPTVERIDDLLEALTTRVTRRRKRHLWEPARYIYGMFSDEEARDIQSDQQDPRAVELALLNVLESVRQSQISLFGVQGLTLPVPEVTFVFDELDKISGVFGADANSTTSSDDRTVLIAERRRAYALQRLISDMKRVISSAPARFIFVGNRLMHDEWSADRGRRQPLLTSIFDTEIYLPNLMLDNRSTPGLEEVPLELSSRIREYLIRRREAAQRRYDKFARVRLSSFFDLGMTGSDPGPLYANDAIGLNSKDTDQTRWKDFSVLRLGGSGGQCNWFEMDHAKPESGLAEPGVQESSTEAEQLLDDFVDFLTFRSGGNPKKLQELLNEFSRPAARFTNPGMTDRWERLDCEDVLAFNWSDVYRVQLISALYAHLVARFETRLIGRDDKVVEAVFYLVDFLMKFHGRAFSWSSLERVDELVHIHRTPDLRDLLIDIVEESSERWLHRLLNGMYAFRFRSDLAIELRYLSRLDQHEAAALNFTLDEAQGLKASYLGALNAPDSDLGRHRADLIAGLGELHEYDQEYEDARARYMEAIDNIDERFQKMVGTHVSLHDPVRARAEFGAERRFGNLLAAEEAALSGQLPPPAQVPFIHAIMEQDPKGARVSGVYMPWGMRRLRLMLQVAMTFELARDYERAKAHYLNARQFAWSLLEAYPKNPTENLTDYEQHIEQARISANTDLAKHMNLLYQPLFAEAWISEKLEGGVDTAGSLVEAELVRLRRRLPFLNNLSATKDRTLEGLLKNGLPGKSSGSADSNFALIGAELHNKAGDLYFFKGRQIGALLDLENDGNKKAHIDIYKSNKERIEIARRGKSTISLEEDEAPQASSADGFLLRAHYHYAVGLHELRRFVVYRRFSSGAKYNPVTKEGEEESRKEPLWDTIGKGDWASFVPQSIHNNMIDIAETTFARISLCDIANELTEDDHSCEVLFEGAKSESGSIESHLDTFRNCVRDWFETPDDELRNAALRVNKLPPITAGDLLKKKVFEFFGIWPGKELRQEKEEGVVSRSWWKFEGGVISG